MIETPVLPPSHIPEIPQPGKLDGSPFEVAATMFGLYTPKLEELLKNLSTGELRRLVNAMVQYPLNDKAFITDSQNLKDAFAMGQSLLEAKTLMMLYTLSEHEKELKKVEEASTIVAKEISNEEVKSS